jgi:cell wall-associated NlpC family hydrolase
MDAGTRQSILTEARTWIGTPYHHKGRVKGVGVDCGGILYELFKDRIKGFRDFPDFYPEDWAMHKENINIYVEFLEPYFDEVMIPEVATIAVFQFGRAFSHGTLFTDRQTFIHAWGRTGKGTVMETPRQFFHDNGKHRPVRYFDVKAELWQS